MRKRNPFDDDSGSSLELAYKLGGNFPEGIDVNALCPMLLAIADLIRASNNTILATEKEILITVKPAKDGSFLLELVLHAKATMGSLLTNVTESDIKKLELLLKAIGLISSGGAGLLKLIKFLRGKPKEVTKLSREAVEYTNQSGNKLTVDGNVHSLFQNCTVIVAMEKAIAEPLKLAEVTKLETYLPKDEAKTKVQVEKSDAALLEQATAEIAPESKATGPQSESSQKVWVTPKTGNYEGAPTSWSFRKVGDKTAFKAKLTDEAFLQKLKSGDIRLSGKDLLQVELSEVQNVQEGTIQRSITKVVEYNQAPAQTNLAALFSKPNKGDGEGK